MALVKCSECGGQVSTDAVSCPHCGSTDFAPSTNERQNIRKSLQAITGKYEYKYLVDRDRAKIDRDHADNVISNICFAWILLVFVVVGVALYGPWEWVTDSFLVLLIKTELTNSPIKTIVALIILVPIVLWVIKKWSK
jgi:uncharacterized membrane protein YvbJ